VVTGEGSTGIAVPPRGVGATGVGTEGRGEEGRGASLAWVMGRGGGFAAGMLGADLATGNGTDGAGVGVASKGCVTG